MAVRELPRCQRRKSDALLTHQMLVMRVAMAVMAARPAAHMRLYICSARSRSMPGIILHSREPWSVLLYRTHATSRSCVWSKGGVRNG